MVERGPVRAEHWTQSACDFSVPPTPPGQQVALVCALKTLTTLVQVCGGDRRSKKEIILKFMLKNYFGCVCIYISASFT